MDEQILPCPYCGGTMPRYVAAPNKAVICPNCYMEGPMDLGKSGAIASWNAVPNRIAALEAEVRRLRAALEQTDVLMDTLATTGIGNLLPPGYRDAWAEAHLAVRAALQQAVPDGE